MNANPTPVTPARLAADLRGDGAPHILDVRTPLEFRECHLPGSRLTPLDEIDAPALAREYPGGACVLVCRSGKRSREAAEKLAQAGMTSPRVLEGGILAWEAAGLPTERDRKVISLERQVRIAAGSIVLAGALLAHFVNPGFIWLSAFIGAGLVFAGLSDWCGMGLLIAKMPWNRASKPSSPAGTAGRPACQA